MGNSMGKKDFRTFKASSAKGGCTIDPKKTAVLCIEFQNEFATEKGKLHDGVKAVMEETGMLDKSVEVCAAARAAGANHAQVIYHSILPQVLPQMADVTFYRWEYNFRASMVVGAVGAGGIGLEIISSLRLIKYQEVCALLIVVLIMVTMVDSLSNYLRKNFVG